MITGEDVPKLCAECGDSYWEDMTCGEMPFCGKYDKLCEEAIKQCDKIMCCKCSECPRGG
jgi:hypothetical protein